MDITTRAEATAAGQTTYFTGKPCSKGHVAPRSVANWGCLTCAAAISKRLYDRISKSKDFVEANRARVRKWTAQNSERAKASGKAWREANKEAVTAKNKAYRLANAAQLRRAQAQRRKDSPEVFKARDKKMRDRPGDKERVAKNGREWRKANAERVRKTKRQYQIANRERIQALGKKWRSANPKKVKAIKAASVHKRRQLIELTGDEVTTAQVMAIFARGFCAACGRTDGPMEIDHIKALSRGGAHHVSNLQLLCRPCNRRKWSKDYDAWLGEQATA